MIDFLGESLESKIILKQSGKLLAIGSINKDLCKCMLNIESILKVHSIDIEQKQVAQIAFLAKFLVSDLSDLPQKNKSQFAACVVDLLRDRQSYVIDQRLNSQSQSMKSLSLRQKQKKRKVTGDKKRPVSKRKL